MHISKKSFNQIVLLMLISTALILGVTHTDIIARGFIRCLNVITPFIVGASIAFVLNIPMHVFETRLFGSLDGKPIAKFKRPISLVLTILFVLALITLMCLIVAPNLSRTFTDVVKQVPLFLAALLDKIISLNIPLLDRDSISVEHLMGSWNVIADKILGFVSSGAGSLVSSTLEIVTSFFGIVVNGAIAFVFAIYLLIAKETLGSQLQKIMQAYLPDKATNRINHVSSLLNQNFTNFVTGQCLDALILGSIFIVVLSICGMPYSVMIGVIISFTALIPVVGAFIGCAIGALLILMTSPIKALIFIILFIVIQQLEGNLIYPKVVGNSVGLPAIWVLVAIAVGGSLLGVVGMLTFIPIASTLYSLLRSDVYRRIKKKNQLQKTQDN